MSESKICTICGGHIGNAILHATLTSGSASAPTIMFCPGHMTTDADLAGHSRIMYTGVVPQGTSVYLQHEEIIDTTSPDFAKNFKGFINKPTQQMQEKMLWAIAQEVAEADVTGYHDVEVCPFCGNGERYMRHSEEFPHASDCIVTKARTLMEWRKAQPQVNIVNKEVPLD